MQSQLSPDLLLTRRQVATEFGISVRYLEISASRDDGPPLVRINRMVRYRVGDLRDWVAAHRVERGSQKGELSLRATATHIGDGGAT